MNESYPPCDQADRRSPHWEYAHAQSPNENRTSERRVFTAMPVHIRSLVVLCMASASALSACTMLLDSSALSGGGPSGVPSSDAGAAFGGAAAGAGPSSKVAGTPATLLGAGLGGSAPSAGDHSTLDGGLAGAAGAGVRTIALSACPCAAPLPTCDAGACVVRGPVM